MERLQSMKYSQSNGGIIRTTSLSSIQAALDSCTDNDIVLVAPGTYVENIIWPNMQGIQLISASSAENTILDGDSLGRVIAITGGVDSTTIVRGFTIQNGYIAGFGGGIYCFNSSPTIMDNIIYGNSVFGAALGGGGIACRNGSSPTIVNNEIISNHATHGAGILAYMTSSPTIRGNTIEYNEADSCGGGVLCDVSCSPTIAGNSVSFNNAQWGGGIFMWHGSSGSIDSNVVTGNVAQVVGGGIYCYIACSPNMRYNTIQSNRSNYSSGDWGSGMRIAGNSSPIVTKCIISNNIGSGVGLLDGSPAFDSCVISGNSTHGFYAVNSPATIHYSEIYDNEYFGIANNSPSDTIDATYNWWGDPSGPGGVGPGTGDEVSYYVLYDPWLMNPVGVEEEIPVTKTIPLSLLCQPNPFATSITLILPSIEQRAERIEINIYDVSGRRVRDFILYPSSEAGMGW